MTAAIQRPLAVLEALTDLIHQHGAVTIDHADQLETRDGPDAVAAVVFGATLSGILGAVLALPEESSVRRDLLVALNGAIHDGDLQITYRPVREAAEAAGCRADHLNNLFFAASKPPED